MPQEYLDFLGETPDDHVNPSSANPVLAPRKRATSPDGLTYLDDGSPTPLYFMRQQGVQASGAGRPAPLPYTDPANEWLTQAAAGRVDANGNRVEQGDPRKLLSATGGAVPASGIPLSGGLVGTLDPARQQRVGETPMFSVSAAPRVNKGDPNFSAAGVPYTLSAGDPSQVPGARIGTQPEAAAGNARYAAQAVGMLPYAPGAALPAPERPTLGGPNRSEAVDADIRAFLAQEQNDDGPSEAEALLMKATDRIQAQTLGTAAGARGGAAARERAQRGAQSANVALGSQATQDLAALRAREEQSNRARQLAIMNLLAGNAQAGDQNALGWGGVGASLYGTDVGAQSGRYDTDANNATRMAVAKLPPDRGETFVEQWNRDKAGTIADLLFAAFR